MRSLKDKYGRNGSRCPIVINKVLLINSLIIVFTASFPSPSCPRSSVGHPFPGQIGFPPEFTLVKTGAGMTPNMYRLL